MKLPLCHTAALPGFLFCVLSGFCAYTGSSAQAAPLPAPDQAAASQPVDTVVIPGPLRSFERMAAISQKVSADDVLPLLARNIFMQGYQRGSPTEFLYLLDHYIQQARELQILAGPGNTIHVTNC